MAIQATPPEDQGGERDWEAGNQDDHCQGCRVEHSTGGEDSIDGDGGLDPPQQQGAQYGASPKSREERPVSVGPHSQVLAGDYRQQRPQSHGWCDEQDGAQHDASYDRFVPHIAAACA
jgi:hypothetical protein